MTDTVPVTSHPIGDAGPYLASGGLFFDPVKTVISQYANSPIILDLIGKWALALDQAANVEAFHSIIWNVSTAKGYGLDILGRIVGVNRVLRIPADVPYLGWANDSESYGTGIFYGHGTITKNYTLTDDAFRRLVLAKAALNICDGSIPALNAALTSLFPDRGNCYVRDNGDMTMTYVFGQQLSAVEYAIVAQAGVLPKPIGVSVSGEVAN